MSWRGAGAVAALLWALVQGAGAQEDYTRALQLQEQVRTLYDAGRFREAIPLAREAAALVERRFGPSNPQTGTALRNLAGVLREAGELAEAGALFERALEISLRTRGPEHPYTAEDLDDVASVHALRGEPDKAEPLLRRALAIREKVLGASHPATADSFNGLARLQEDRGRYGEAEALYRQALALHERYRRGPHPATADTLNDLAGVLLASGRVAEAEPLLRRALAMRRTLFGPTHPTTATTLTNLATLLWDTGAYPEAEALYREALPTLEQKLGRDDPATVSALRHIALLRLKTDQLDEAEPLLRQVLAAREARFGADHPLTADSLEDLGELYRQRGDPAQARAWLERALAARERRSGADSLAVARSLSALSVVAFDAGEAQRAEALGVRAAALFEQALGASHAQTAAAWRNLAVLAWSRGHFDVALAQMRRASEADDRRTDLALAAAGEARLGLTAATLEHGTDQAISLSIAARERVPEAADAGAELLLRRKGRVMDVMAAGAVAARSRADPARRALVERWARAQRRLAGLEGASPLGDRLRTAQADRVAARTELAAAESELVAQGAAPVGRSVSLADLRAALAPDQVLLEWVRYRPFLPRAGAGPPRPGNARYAVFAIRREHATRAVDLGEAAPIDNGVSDLLAALRSRSPLVPTLARELGERLWLPMGELVAPGARVLLAPDGALLLLPFAVLRGADDRMLIERHELAWLTGGRDLLRTPVARTDGDPALVLAAPDYGEPPAGATAPQFAPLPGALDEAQALRDALQGWRPQVLTGAAATKEVLRAAHAPRILHLATHAYFLPDPQAAAPRPTYRLTGDADMPLLRPANPLLRAGLALAGANAGPGRSEGILTALELSGLDLQGTELAVLSACDTGVGTIAGTEGVYGLRRALVLAGVRTSIVTLWPVGDRASAALMGDFYRRVAGGAGRAAALRAAQRALAARPEYADPFHWAGFVLIGDTGPLERAR